ncbi:MAG: hypothetical protein HYW02_06330 [Deltaproteobacteria bacterium]|nr:hypothetical protein [Deltaproteobacteria bacterium]
MELWGFEREGETVPGERFGLFFGPPPGSLGRAAPVAAAVPAANPNEVQFNYSWLGDDGSSEGGDFKADVAPGADVTKGQGLEKFFEHLKGKFEKKGSGKVKGFFERGGKTYDLEIGQAVPKGKKNGVLGIASTSVTPREEKKPEAAAQPGAKPEPPKQGEAAPGDEKIKKLEGQVDEMSKLLKAMSEDQEKDERSDFDKSLDRANGTMERFGRLGETSHYAMDAWGSMTTPHNGGSMLGIQGLGGNFQMGVGGGMADFGMAGGIGGGSTLADTRAQNRKLEALINFLIAQILMGNIDAITSAMIAISRKSKQTLIRSSVSMLRAMQHYDKQQDALTDQFEKMQPKGNESANDFSRRSTALSLKLNGIAAARQMFMNQLRDVMTMTEEVGNVEKSLLDITGQFRRHYSRFNV